MGFNSFPFVTLDAAPERLSLSPRAALRRRLLVQRAQFAADHETGLLLSAALAAHLTALLAQLEPQRLGLYWPMRAEFNAPLVLAADEQFARLVLALPFTQRTPRQMHYRAWDGAAPTLVDECGIRASSGPHVVPDVVLAPCVGFTDSGFRLGYGGGYFDRFMAAHPHVTAVGVAWSVGRIDAVEFEAAPHDRPLSVIVTERGVV